MENFSFLTVMVSVVMKYVGTKTTTTVDMKCMQVRLMYQVDRIQKQG